MEQRGASTTVSVHGHADDGSVIQVEVPASGERRLVSLWPPQGLALRAVGPTSPARVVRLRSGVAGTLHVEVDGQTAFGGWDRVESELALFAAERLAGTVAVHAGLIVAGERAILLPGPTGVGKSSLCVAAGAAGLAVLSDEFALVDPKSGLVTGWKRPVRVRTRGGGVERVDLAVESPPLPIDLVAFLRFVPAMATRLDDVRPSDAVIGLLANTVCARSRPDEAMDAALAIARRSCAVDGVRGDAPVALVELIDRLGAGPQPSGTNPTDG